MHTPKNQAVVTFLFMLFGLPVLFCSAAPSVTFVAGTSAGWDFHELAGDGVLLQTIYGTAQDSAGNITANTSKAMSADKGCAMVFSVPQATALDKGIFKCFNGGWIATNSLRIRLYNVTGKNYLAFSGHPTLSKAEPGGTGNTAIFDIPATIPSPVPVDFYHLELGDGRQYVDMIINFGPLEVTAGEYLLVFDRATGSNTWGSMVRGNTAAVADAMGKYSDGTVLPKRATVSTSAGTGNTFHYELATAGDTTYTARSYLLAYQITTAIINAPPVVNAGNNQTIINPADTVNLNGTVTDDGVPNPPGAVTTLWTKQSGPGIVTFGDANAVDTTATFSVYGAYVLRLTANDGLASTYDEVQITYLETAPANTAPVVNAGPDQQTTLSYAANLSGTVTDDGLPNPPGQITMQWTLQSGPGTVTFGNSNAASTTASFSAIGTYVLRLTASDSILSSYDEITITVNPQPAAPRRVILFYIDGLAVNVPETYMPYFRDTYIPQGCYYSASHIPLPAQPAQDNNPSSSTYYPWSCSIPNPVAMSGSVFIGISDIKSHLLQYSFIGTSKSTAFVTNDTAYEEIKGGYTYYQELSPNTNDDPVIQTAETWIQNYNPYYLRIHLQATGMGGWTDNYAGRTIWQSNSTYRQQAIHADGLLNDFITWLKSNPTPGNNYWADTVMIIAGDHGQSDWGGHDWWDQKANKTPMLILGKGIKAGQRFDYAECIDIPATICNLLDVNVPKYCDGRVLTETYVGGPSSSQAAGYMERVNSTLIDSYNYHNANPGCHSILLYGTAYNRILPITKIARWHFNFDGMLNLTNSYEKYYDTMKISCAGPNPDLTNDGFVNMLDLKTIADNWLETGGSIPGDIYDDQIVNMLDFALLAKYWLE